MCAKRWLALVFLAVVIVATAACGGQNQGAQEDQVSQGVQGKKHFRNVYWGMSRDQVKAAETAKPAENSDETLLAYECKLMDRYDCTLFYVFSNEGELVAGGYELKTLNTPLGEETNLSSPDALESNLMLAVDLYDEIKNDLNEKLGKICYMQRKH